MNRPLLAAALVVAATAMSGCAASSAPDVDDASDAPTPAASPVESEAPTQTEPVETEPAETTEPAADGETEALREHCEMIVRERFVADEPRLTTEDDHVATAATIGFDLPAEPTCGVVYVPEGGGTFTLHVYVDQPEVAAALTAGFAEQGWAKSQEQGAGYVLDVYTQGEVSAGVSPIGVDNGISAWGTLWPGKDVTLLGVEQP